MCEGELVRNHHHITFEDALIWIVLICIAGAGFYYLAELGAQVNRR
jgi:hypothetical protein